MLRKSFVVSLVGALSLALTGAVSAQAGALPRVSASQKGSLLIFSKIEIKWDEQGNVIQDTFLDMANDSPAGEVHIQGYFINGDAELEQICNGEPERDPQGNCFNEVQSYEPGWNTADCGFTLTAEQPSFWSAAQGNALEGPGFRGFKDCTAFRFLDEDGPGRLDFEPGALEGDRVLRGYLILWADKFFPDPVPNPDLGGDPDRYECGSWRPINWNHLKGDGLIVNYRNGTAWEYNAWAFQAHQGIQGESLGIPGGGVLSLDGVMYDAPYSQLLLDFYGTGSTALSGPTQEVIVETDLTVHAVSADVRQDGCGPVLTKIEASIWNEFETKFSGTRRCVCCWDQTMLSEWSRSAAIPNHFKRTALRTDKGKARLDGVESTECNYYELCGYSATLKRLANECPRQASGGAVAGGGPIFLGGSEDAAILGLATKFLDFTSSGDRAAAGMNLVGMGDQLAFINYVPDAGSCSLKAPESRGGIRTIGDKSSKGLSGAREFGGR